MYLVGTYVVTSFLDNFYIFEAADEASLESLTASKIFYDTSSLKKYSKNSKFSFFLPLKSHFCQTRSSIVVSFNYMRLRTYIEVLSIVV